MLLKYADDGDNGGPGLLGALGLLALGGAGGFLARRPLARALRNMRKKVKAQGLTSAPEAAAAAQPAAAAAATKPVQEAAVAASAAPTNAAENVVQNVVDNAVAEQVEKVPLRQRVSAASKKLQNTASSIASGVRSGARKSRELLGTGRKRFAQAREDGKRYLFGYTPEDTRSSWDKGRERVGNWFRGLAGKAPVSSAPQHVPGAIENAGTALRNARARGEDILENQVKPGATKLRNLFNKGRDTIRSVATAEGRAARKADQIRARAMSDAAANYAQAEADWNKRWIGSKMFNWRSRPNLNQFQNQARAQAEAQIQASAAAAAQRPGIVQRILGNKPQPVQPTPTPTPQPTPAPQPVPQPQTSIGARIKGGLGNMRQGIANFGQNTMNRFGTMFGNQQK